MVLMLLEVIAFFFPQSKNDLQEDYFNGKLVKEETLYLESNSSLLYLSLGNFNKDVSRVEKQAETSD